MISKKQSLHLVLDSCNPDIIALCETKLGSQSKPKLPNYECVYGNFKRGKEGLLVAAREGTFVDIEKMTSDDDNEDKNVMAVQIKYPNFSLRVVVAHAPQESDSTEMRERFFSAVKLEIERGQLNGDQVIIMGDMNGRICDKGGGEQYSPNGDSMKCLIEEHTLQVANFHPTTEGKWTRIQKTKKGERKSIIDYIMVDEFLYNKISELMIDESKAYTPYWVTRKNNVLQVVSSDHCAMIITLSVDVGEKVDTPDKPEKVWKVTEEGLKKYKEITSERSLFFTSKDTSDMYEQWWHHLENSLNKCFKKRIPGTKNFSRLKCQSILFVREVLNKIAKKGKVQREVITVYRQHLLQWEMKRLEEIRVDKLKDTLSQFSEDERTPPNAYWKILKSVKGKEKTKISSILKNDGVEIFSKDLIKHEVLEEFKSRLRNREPAEDWEDFVHVSNELVELLMTAEVEDGANFSLEELLAAIKKLIKKKAPGPDGVISEFLLEAGEGILLPLLDIFNEIKQTKIPPKQWNSVLITIIYKNKGSRKSLVNYRGIFLASVVSKVFERMIKYRIKEFMNKVDYCQAGARSNRGPPDNTFILNAVIDHSIYTGKSLHITTYDFEQAFDSLWLQDCILSLRKLGVPDYILQLIYNLNKEAVITVNTPHGKTSSAIISDIVQQGRVLAPDLCSCSTAEYCGTNKGIAVGTCIISSLAFVDDMLDISELDEAEAAHLKAIAFSLRKKLKYSLAKCEGMVINGKKDSENLPALFLEEDEMKHVKHTKYIGDIFQQNGKNDELIKDRVNRGTKAMLKIEAILAEVSFGQHTMNVSLLLYRALFLSSVIFNSQSWRNLTEKNIAQLQSIQVRLLKKFLNAPSSTSNSFVFLELGVLPIRYEIHQRQLTFLHHIVNLNEDDPVYCLYENMKRLPGERNWFNDVVHSANTYGIDIDESMLKSISKETFKKRVKHKVQQYAFASLKTDCASKSKTGDVVYSSFQLQPYLTNLYPNHAKTIFKCRAKCLKIKTHRPYQFSNKVCRWCNLEEESLAHILNCGWEEKVELMDIEKLEDIDYSEQAKLVSISTRVNHFLDMVDY